MTSPDTIQRTLAQSLRRLAVPKLPITPYSRVALQRTVDAAEYYLDIYRHALEQLLDRCAMSPADITVVDYGGGHGLLSLLAKRLGFSHVVYVDSNADAVQTVRVLADMMGNGPDVVLQGDAATLRDWCAANAVVPDALLAMDVIEHIYVLDEFFAALHDISPRMRMVFTTASNPYNRRVVRRLRRAMNLDELGDSTHKGFLQLRREHIRRLHPDMPDKQLDYWAGQTRGLTYDDVTRAVESQSPNLLLDPFNTCDPATGSWTERVLPLDDYRQLLAPYGFRLTVLPGRYNDHRHGPKAWASRHYNRRIDKAPQAEPASLRERRRYRRAMRVAPFMYMYVAGEAS